MTITIATRYSGPPESGNGGWVSGALAEHVRPTCDAPAITVRLSSPPPLERPLAVVGDGDGSGNGTVRLLDGDHLVATAAPAPVPAGPVAEPVPPALARAAEAAYEGLVDHPFPTCFVCGTGRDPADALCLRPGPVGDGTGRYASSWVPREATVPVVWGSLDCPGGWSAGFAGRPLVLGTMTTHVLALPRVGEPHVVVGWPRGGEGRKFLSGSALYTAEGELLAHAEATWIAVDPQSVLPRRSTA
jgi:hypothetical protein